MEGAIQSALKDSPLFPNWAIQLKGCTHKTSYSQSWQCWMVLLILYLLAQHNAAFAPHQKAEATLSSCNLLQKVAQPTFRALLHPNTPPVNLRIAMWLLSSTLKSCGRTHSSYHGPVLYELKINLMQHQDHPQVRHHVIIPPVYDHKERQRNASSHKPCN